MRRETSVVDNLDTQSQHCDDIKGCYDTNVFVYVVVVVLSKGCIGRNNDA